MTKLIALKQSLADYIDEQFEEKYASEERYYHYFLNLYVEYDKIWREHSISDKLMQKVLFKSLAEVEFAIPGTKERYGTNSQLHRVLSNNEGFLVQGQPHSGSWWKAVTGAKHTRNLPSAFKSMLLHEHYPSNDNTIYDSFPSVETRAQISRDFSIKTQDIVFDRGIFNFSFTWGEYSDFCDTPEQAVKTLLEFYVSKHDENKIIIDTIR